MKSVTTSALPDLDPEKTFILECERGHRCIEIQVAQTTDAEKPPFCSHCKCSLYVNLELTNQIRKDMRDSEDVITLSDAIVKILGWTYEH